MKAFVTPGTAFAAALVAVVALGVPPATATGGAVTFDGTTYIDCFGCPARTWGVAQLTVSGALANGTALVTAPVTAYYSAYEDNDPTTCVISGSARGYTTGAVSVDFYWTRVGAWAVIVTSGDVNGYGTALFVVTHPVGIPCQTVGVQARVTGMVVGV